jgi:hypothetical protein
MGIKTVWKDKINGWIIETDFNDLYDEYSTSYYETKDVPKDGTSYVVPVDCYAKTVKKARKNHNKVITRYA